MQSFSSFEKVSKKLQKFIKKYGENVEKMGRFHLILPATGG